MTDQTNKSTMRFNPDQQMAIDYVGTNILVSASAGSGKTAVLVERIIQHMLNGRADIDELLVVTFTEPAAFEMKQRIESRLKQAVNETTDGDDQRYLIEQIRKLPDAHIRTLHSFCLQVIQSFFYLEDFDPGLQLETDETRLRLLQEGIWSDLVAKIMTGEHPVLTAETYLNLLTIFSDGRSDDNLFDLILNIYHFAMANPDPLGWLEKAGAYYESIDNFSATDLFKETLGYQIEDNLMAAFVSLEQAQSGLASLSDEQYQRYQPVIEGDIQLIVGLKEAYRESFADFLDQLNQVKFDNWPRKPSKDHDDVEILEELKDYRDQATDRIKSGLSSLFTLSAESYQAVDRNASQWVEALLALTKAFYEDYQTGKAAEMMMEYNDLEHMTLQLLQRNGQPTAAADYYQALFKEVLVDEYQDINEIQAAILSYLSTERSTDQPGNLFMVGDVKQSIYGFRMAEPSLFIDKYTRYDEEESDGQLIRLNRNYRSRPEILEWANFIFERVMDSTFGQLTYSKDEMLVAGSPDAFEPQPPDSRFGIDLLLYESKAEDTDQGEDEKIDVASEWPFANATEAECYIIALDIEKRIKSGMEVYDKKTETMRPLRLSDIVVLSSTKKPFNALQRTLEDRQIPIVTQSPETYFQRQEIQLMVALLKLIDNPRQDIPLATILRSYFVGVDDEGLARIRVLHPEGYYHEAVLAFINETQKPADQSLQYRLKKWFNQLDDWRKRAQSESLVDLIWSIYQETGYLDYVSGLDNGPQRSANLHALYQLANQYAKGSYLTVNRFIEYIEQMLERDNDLAEPLLIDDDHNYVRAMTVHSSKGLEFPLVYLMNTGKRFNLADATHQPVVMLKNEGIATDGYDLTHYYKYPSLVKTAFKQGKTDELKAEEMRKLYVALTRCEQKLIIVGSTRSEESWYDKIETIRQATPTDQLLIADYYRRKANSWLDWIQGALAVSQTQATQYNQFDVDLVETVFIQPDQLAGEIGSVGGGEEDLASVDHDQVAQTIPAVAPDLINKLLAGDYPYRLATNTSSYQSVSELKRLYEEPRIPKSDYYQDRSQPEETAERPESIQSIRFTGDSFQPPQFIKAQEPAKADPTIKGTVTHYFLQHLDFSGLKEGRPLKHQADQLVAEGIFSQEEADLIDYPSIDAFLTSPMGEFLVDHADGIVREQAFSMQMPASLIFKQSLGDEVDLVGLSDDQLLIHGVIDGYVVSEDKVILFDYKTNRYRPYGNLSRDAQIAQLKDNYRFQLSLYARALAASLERPVDEVYMILLDFNEVVLMDELYLFE